MLNPILQQSIDEELSKADIHIRDFINSKYWSDTMSLIARVNHIQNPEIIEGIELEIIVYILNTFI